MEIIKLYQPSKRMKILITLTSFLLSCRFSPDFDRYYPGILQNSSAHLSHLIGKNNQNYRILITDNLIHYNPAYPYTIPRELKGNYLKENEVIQNFGKTNIPNAIANSKNHYTFEYIFENPREETTLLHALTYITFYFIPKFGNLQYTLKTKFYKNGIFQKEYFYQKSVKTFDWFPLFIGIFLSEPYKNKEDFLFYLLIKETNAEIEMDFFGKGNEYLFESR